MRISENIITDLKNAYPDSAAFDFHNLNQYLPKTTMCRESLLIFFKLERFQE